MVLHRLLIGCLDLPQICQIASSCLRLTGPGMLLRPLFPIVSMAALVPYALTWDLLLSFQRSLLPSQQYTTESTRTSGNVLTLESLVRTSVPILVRMRKQRQLPIRFLDLSITTGSLDRFESENVVKSRGRAFPHPCHCGLLLDCECASTATVVVIAVFGVSIRSSIRARCPSRHGVEDVVESKRRDWDSRWDSSRLGQDPDYG